MSPPTTARNEAHQLSPGQTTLTQLIPTLTPDRYKFQVGDLVERPHPTLSEFVIFGTVHHVDNDRNLLTGCWLYLDYDGTFEMQQICNKIDTVPMNLVRVLAKRQEQLDFKQFNW